MSAWSELRAQARAWHDVLNPGPGLAPAALVLEAASLAAGVEIVTLPAGDVLLDNSEASYDPDGPQILVSAALSAEARAFHVAHEFGHHRLHHPKSGCCDEDVDPFTAAEPETTAVGESDGYSPKQRREAQANVYGRELLLPRDRLRTACLSEALTAEALAARLGLDLAVVRRQMADALLLPDEPTPLASGPPPPLDPSQRRAAEAEAGPLQVRAGPGTGKTRTLVGRAHWLINTRGVDAASILALSYSNGSAEDLARRLRQALGADATAIWCSTFHAFGQELLRRYGPRLGLTSAPTLVDRADALFLLESQLEALQLDHYFDLIEPLRGLKAVLDAISRAKDELCGPARYRELSEAMPAGEARDKALEVAHVYQVYDAALRRLERVDFGDLILRSVELLRDHPDVAAEVRATYRHVLIDEYQDMNAASGTLLRLLAGPSAGPWVVGDVRQSIYRFRGASPLNMSRFTDAFENARTEDLEINYRSGGHIVSLFDAFGRTMTAAPHASAEGLEPHRGPDTGEVQYRIAATREAEAEGIARDILAHSLEPGDFRRHAVLARSHGVLCAIAGHFERAGIPALYFGDFFERSEVRDLLSLVSVTGERDGLGLLRVARLPRYDAPMRDILELLRFRHQADVTLLVALRRRGEAALSSEGRIALDRLAADLAGVDFMTTPHDLLIGYLFGPAGAVYRAPFAGDDVTAQKRRLAAYQLLALAFQYRSPSGRDPKRGFLAHIRRLEVLDEEKELRRLPAAASGIDAVQLMTVHGSKGLEFPTVFIPSVSPSYFPAPGRGEPCPPPPGLIEPDPLMTPAAEEEGLMFVGLSRARDRLVVSRANRYGGWSRPNPSSLLKPILPRLAPGGEPPPHWTDPGAAVPGHAPQAAAQPLGETLSVTALEDYLTCPRRYYYGEALGLSGRLSDTPYLRFHDVIRNGLSWLREAGADGAAGLTAHLEGSWPTRGPADHPAANHYRSAAERMLARAGATMTGPPLATERSLTLAGVTVTARADHVQRGAAGVMIHRLKAGRLARSGETAKPRYALLQAVVSRDEGVPASFTHVSLVDGEELSATLSNDKLQKALDDTAAGLDGIRSGRFDPRPNGRTCPTCPFFFVCPTDGLPA